MTTVLKAFTQPPSKQSTPSVGVALCLNLIRHGPRSAISMGASSQTGCPSISDLKRPITNLKLPTTRTCTPIPGDKRRRSDSVDSEDLRSTQSPKATASESRPRAKDLDDLSKEVVMHAIDLYRCSISTEIFFPDHNEEPPLVRRAFNKSCKALNLKMIMTPAIYKLVRYISRTCDQEGEYGEARAEDLKEEACFAFKDTERKKGLFNHPILQKGTNATWFANRRDDDAALGGRSMENDLERSRFVGD
ncbi:hypothetical protein B0H14DRAFT_3480868 [Mycena olivaceomarginata]|nr:hypothetical protein B0H14DRAFT_3480868 [Mycena olivaceomarginata]